VAFLQAPTLLTSTPAKTAGMQGIVATRAS